MPINRLDSMPQFENSTTDMKNGNDEKNYNDQRNDERNQTNSTNPLLNPTAFHVDVMMNLQQYEAVTMPLDSKVQLVAGPGTGKTYTLANRVAYLLSNYNSNSNRSNRNGSDGNGDDIEPPRILVITLTNRASSEFQSRLTQILGPIHSQHLLQYVKISTVHSYCQDLVTKNIASLGMSEIPLVVTPLDQKLCTRMASKRLSKMGLGRKGGTSKGFKSVDVGVKEFGRVLKNKLERSMSDGLDGIEQVGEGSTRSQILDAYNQEIRQHKLLDYADMIIYSNQLLSQSSPSSPQSQEPLLQDSSSSMSLPESTYPQEPTFLQYDHVLVDEFQDISLPLWQIIYKISKNAKSLFVVGDPQQSIFGFSGSGSGSNRDDGEEENMFAEMRKVFKETKTVKLVKNYRSTQSVIDACNELVKGDYTKGINTHHDTSIGNGTNNDNKSSNSDHQLISGSPLRNIKPQLLKFPSQSQELDFIAQEIKNLVKSGTVPISEIVILVRTGTKSSELVSFFKKKLSKVSIKANTKTQTDNNGNGQSNGNNNSESARKDNSKSVGKNNTQIKPVFIGSKSVFSTSPADLCSTLLRLIRFPHRDFFVLGVIREYKKFVSEADLEILSEVVKKGNLVNNTITGDIGEFKDMNNGGETSLFEVLKNSDSHLSPKKSQKVHQFVQMVINARHELLTSNPYNIHSVIKVLKYCLSIIEYFKYVPKPQLRVKETKELFEFLEDCESKIEKLVEKNGNKSFVDVLLTPNLLLKEGLDDYGSQNDLSGKEEQENKIDSIEVGEGNEGERRRSNQLTISTFHAAKGLQWRAVFIPQLSEQNIPFYNPFFKKELSQREVSEEKRVLYVGMSRAKQRLYLSYSGCDGEGETEALESSGYRDRNGGYDNSSYAGFGDVHGGFRYGGFKGFVTSSSGGVGGGFAGFAGGSNAKSRFLTTELVGKLKVREWKKQGNGEGDSNEFGELFVAPKKYYESNGVGAGSNGGFGFGGLDNNGAGFGNGGFGRLINWSKDGAIGSSARNYSTVRRFVTVRNSFTVRQYSMVRCYSTVVSVVKCSKLLWKRR